MSSTTPGRPAMDQSLRRGSWARALDKVRAAMKRRGSSSRTQPHAAPLGQEAASAGHAALKVTGPANIVAAPPSELRDDDAKPLAAAPELQRTPSVDAIAVQSEDQAEPDEDLDELLLPMFSTRTTITDERAQALFARYGLQYEPRSRRPQQEPPNKIRRVEKPVRLRVHWKCHDCGVQFGVEKTCTSCGHRRCRDCTRHPPKRVKDMSDTMRQQMEQEQRDQQELGAGASSTEPGTDVPPAVDTDLLQYRQEPAAPAQISSSPKGSPRTPTVSGGLLSQDPVIDENAHTHGPSPPLTLYTRPRSAVVLKPKAQIVRRTCHKCDSHIVPAGRRDCAHCGHEKCDLCPRYPPKKDHWSESAMKTAREYAPMAKTVQRVYRKPRQRVRYTCENCNTLFIDSERCVECGHQRCDTCHREPPRRQTHQFDPELVDTAVARLATFSADPGQQTAVAASAG